MKKTLLILFALLLFASYADARGFVACAGGGVGAAALSCTGSTVQQSETTDNDYWQVGYGANYRHISSQFTYAGTTGTLCRVDALVLRTGTLTSKNLTMTIYSNNGDNNQPSSSALTCSGVVDAQSVSDSSAEWKSFTSCSGTITNGTSYHVVMSLPDVGDSSNYIRWRLDSDCTVENMYRSPDASTWTSATTIKCGTFKLYIEE